MALKSVKVNNSEKGEPATVEFFRELSERFLYWDKRGREGDEDCANIANSYKKLMNGLTSEVE